MKSTLFVRVNKVLIRILMLCILVSYSPCGASSKGSIPDHSLKASKNVSFTKNEVIIKLKEHQPNEILFNQTYSTRMTANETILSRLKNRYALKDPAPAFKQLHNRLKLKNLSQNDFAAQLKKPVKTGNSDLFPVYVLKTDKNPLELCSQLRNDRDIEYAEPNYLYFTTLVPDDPRYSEQWAHQTTQAESGWDIETGDPGTIIAIIDTGIDPGHEDLTANLVTGYDFVDINTSAYVDAGYGLVTGEDYSVADSDPSDYNGHGTHCAGIAAGKGNNSIGISGVAYNASLMPVRAGFSIIHPVYGEVGSLENDDIANAIDYAVTNSADVLSMSFGGPFSQIMSDAIDFAASNGVVLIASAGNSSSSALSFPAGNENVISVSATADDDTIAYYSNFGYWIDVAAPGGDSGKDTMILSTVPAVGTISDPSGYLSIQGTSMAAPYVAGLAGLILKQNPSFTADDVKRAIYLGTDDLGNPGHDESYGFGRVNIQKSLSAGSQTRVLARIKTAEKSEQIEKLFVIKGTAAANDFMQYVIQVGEGENPTEWTETGITLPQGGTGEVINGTLGQWDYSGFSDGIYTIQLIALNNSMGYAVHSITVDIINLLQLGWPQETLAGSSSYVDSPVIADIDNDGDLEVIASSYEGLVYVWHHDGTPAAGWPIYIGEQALTPAVGDLNGNGYKEIVVGTNAPYQDEKLFILRHDGSSFPGDWPKGSGAAFNNEINYISDAPTLADLDENGTLEILVGNERSEMCAWYHNGNTLPNWPVSADNSQNLTTPAVGDIDGDGEVDIVFAESGVSGVEIRGNVYAFHMDGSSVAGNWPVNVKGTLYPPVIGDIDGDGKLEIVVNADAGLFAFEGDGTVITGWPITGSSEKLGYGIPALGDLDGDNIPEIVLSAGGTGLSPSKVWVLKGDGSTFGSWPYEFSFTNPAYTYGAVIANFDDDAEQEVIVSAYDSYNSLPYIFVFKNDGSLSPGYPKQIDIEYFSIPALGDIDGDNDLDLAAFGMWDGETPTPFYVYDFKGNYPGSRKMDWPMMMHNAVHTGLLESIMINDELAVDFKTSGAWVYNSTDWTRIYNGVDPEKLCSFNTQLAMDLGTAFGLYVYDSGIWSRVYKGVNIEKMTDFNDNLVIDFGNTYGIYEYDYNLDTWERIYKYSSTRDEVISVGGRLVVDFKDLGVYEYQGGIWSRFYKGIDVEKVVPLGDMVAFDFGTAYGLYLYDFNADTWIRIYKGVPIEKIVEFDGKLAVDFGTTHGLYAYDHTADTWTRIYKGVAIKKMTGFSDKLAVDFGTAYGIYEYDFTSNTWIRIYKYNVERDEIISANIFN